MTLLNPNYQQTKMWFSPLLLILILFLTTFVFVDSRAINPIMSNERHFSSKSTTVAKTISVSQSGQADFKKIQDAIDSIPSNNNEWICVRVSSGVYMEKVFIPIDKPYILLQGDGADTTIIKWGDHDQTDESATFTSHADNFVAKGICFQNSYNVAYDDEANQPVKQAVAAYIRGDKSAFYGCSFVGLQDTLWDVQGRHYFNNCYIQGAIDFIFGDGQSFYENCEIRVVYDQFPPSYGSGGFITAQGRQSGDDPGGFVFYGGRVTGNGTGVFLGRAWGSYSRVIFQKIEFGIDVAPEGWDAWNKPTDHTTYVEQDCFGKGYDVSKRVTWSQHSLSENEMQPYTKTNFIQDGWLTIQPEMNY